LISCRTRKSLNFINFFDQFVHFSGDESWNKYFDHHLSSFSFEKLILEPEPQIIHEKEEAQIEMIPNSNSRKRPKFFNVVQKMVLNDWFEKNIQNPYPTHQEVDKLIEYTILTSKQILTYLTNKRTRYKNKIWQNPIFIRPIQ
jgi:hypothetical protein